ncbi:GNAT family N-acetyltransferase [Kribbella sp. NPDC020789]
MLIRPATADDLDFLAAMLLEACNWEGTPWFTPEKVRTDHKVWQYLEGWPRSGDIGVVAKIDGVPAGATWARVVPGGYGYVADDVPELTLGVSADFRRRGVARALLEALAGAARAASYRRLSLSVDPGNPAAVLYRSAGFRKVGVSGTSDTMVREL